MGHGHFPQNIGRLRRFNKKKMIIAALAVAVIGLIVLAFVATVLIVIIKAILGQADGSIGQSLSSIIQTIWNAALDFIRALWKQIVANPLQFLTGN